MFEFTIKDAEFLNSFKDKISEYVNKSYKFTMGFLASPILCEYNDNERLILIAINKSVYQNLYSFLHLNHSNMQYAAFSCLETALYAMRVYKALATSPDDRHTYITSANFSLEDFEDREAKKRSAAEPADSTEANVNHPLLQEEQFSVKDFYDSLHLFNPFVLKSPSISSQLNDRNIFLGLSCGKELSDELQDEVRKNLIGAYLSLSKHTKLFFNGGLDHELEDLEDEIYEMFKEYVKKFS